MILSASRRETQSCEFARPLKNEFRPYEKWDNPNQNCKSQISDGDPKQKEQRRNPKQISRWTDSANFPSKRITKEASKNNERPSVEQ